MVYGHGIARCSLLLAYACAAAASSSNTTFRLGVVGPITSVSQSFLAGAVLFDLDFRKNANATLRKRFGPPIVEVQDLNPSLSIHPILGTSGPASSGMGMDTVLDWLLPHGEEPAVDGIVGGLDSDYTGWVLGVTSHLHAPHVAWSATSPRLSDRQHYHYFARTVASDAAQGLAVWAWMEYFNVPTVAFLYASADPVGERVFQVTADLAQDVAGKVHGVAVLIIPNMPFDATSYVAQVRATGSRFLMLALPSGFLPSVWPAMDTEGMLYSGVYQTLAFTWFELQFPTQGLPLGFQQFRFASAGSKFELLEQMWTLLEVEDIYGDEARMRYRLNELRESLENASAPILTDLDFNTTTAIEPLVSFMFDACYAYVFALNALLNQGLVLDEISGDAIWNAIRFASFEGASGMVSFDSFGERAGSYTLVNARWMNSSVQELVSIGKYDATLRTLALQQPPVWTTGEENPLLPSALLDCAFGFEISVFTGLCTPCQPGIGCGFQAEAGFPVGMYGPFTSLSHKWLVAAILVDLDIQKGSDPSLVDRFGPPIVEIPNLHRNFKLKLQLGTSDSEVATGMDTTLDWFLGRGKACKVAAVCGGYHSSIASPVASNAAVFETPQVLWGATSATLSDRTLYPWLSRVITPDNFQAKAVWAWMNHFEIPAVVALYARELFSQGLFQNLAEIAVSAGQSSRISGVGMQVQLGESGFDLNILLDGLESVRNTGQRVIIGFLSDRPSVLATFTGMNMTGMITTHQLVGADSLARGSTGLPSGLHWILQVDAGPLFQRFSEMWHLMTPDDVYGTAAQEKYLYDSFRVHPFEGAADVLVEDDFVGDPELYAGFLLDSVYIVALAINSLLNANATPQEIYGERLLDEIRRTSFEGVTGMVQLDDKYDRAGDYSLLNANSSGLLTEVALWASSSDTLSFKNGFEELVWMTGSISPIAPDELVACSPGQQWDSTTGLCIWCPVNWYSSGGVREGAKCSPCTAGNISIIPLGATGCKQCPNGTFRTIADEQCIPCPLGTFGSDSGQSACINCPVGTYSASEGQQDCEACGLNSSVPELFTTMARVDVNGVTEFAYVTAAKSSDMCGCDRNSRNISNGDCIACGTGVECRGMGDVRIKPGFFAEAMVDGGLSVFRCYTDDSHCVGGVPGETCARGRTGIVCAECEQFKTPSQSGGCEDCGSNDTGPFVATILGSCVIMLVLYCMIDSSERVGQSQNLVLCGIACGQLVTLIQQLGAVGKLFVRWEEPMKSALQMLGVLAFDIEVLRINCVRSQGPLERFSVKVCIIFFTVGYMLLVHFTIVIIRFGRKLYKRVRSLIGAVGLMFMVFYISVATTVLEPFQCQSHPNGKWTIHSYPATICWETPEHRAMLVIGILAFLAVPVAFLVATCYAVWQFPIRMRAGDTAFLRATSFLFVRFRPGQHAFVIVQLLRSLFIAIVLLVPDLALQVASLQLVLLVGYTLSLHLLPFRVPTANILDCVFGASTLGVVCLVAFFLEDDQLDLGGLSWLTFMIVAVILTIGPCVILVGIVNMFVRHKKPFQFFLCHHKNSTGAYTRLLKISLKESPKVKQDVFLDSDNLDNLDRLFDYVANETGTLVVVVSEAIFTRPWCIGEICTAMVKHVPVVLLALPSATLPDTRFIEEADHRVEGLEALTVHGIGLELLLEVLRWIPHQFMIKVPARVSNTILATIVERLVAKEQKDVHNDGCESTFNLMISSDTTIHGNSSVYDGNNLEAAATAYILRKMLMPLMSHKASLIPRPLESDLPRPGVMVIICTNGLLESPETHETFLHVAAIEGCSFLPLLSEQGFRFPGKDFVQQLQSQSSGLSDTDAATVGHIVDVIFHEIAITFEAKHTAQAHLSLAAEQVSHRLLRARTLFVSMTPDASTTRVCDAPAGVVSEPDGDDDGDGLKRVVESEKDKRASLEEVLDEVHAAPPHQSEASSDISCWLAMPV